MSKKRLIKRFSIQKIKGVLLLLLFTFAFVLFSCSESKTNISKTKLTKNNISADLLWKRITQEDNYKRWSNWPGLKGFFKGQVPHGSYHKVYISEEIKDAIPITSKRIPDNGIIVKENYTPNKEFDSYTIMAKVSGFDPEHNDWFWAKYDKDGKPIASGILQGCINCHKARENNDYVMIHTLGEQEDEK